jgi:hypothetical protein
LAEQARLSGVGLHVMMSSQARRFFNHIRRLRKRDPYADLDSPQTIEQREMARNWRAGE